MALKLSVNTRLQLRIIVLHCMMSRKLNLPPKLWFGLMSMESKRRSRPTLLQRRLVY